MIIFFFVVKKKDCREVVRILNASKEAFDQEVNVCKSRIMFSKNTRELDKREATKILGFTRIMQNDCYLGLPLFFGRGKVKELRFIKERIWQRV